MKKLALIGLLSTLFVTMVFGQGDPKKAYKRAKSHLGTYKLDQTKYDKLLEAKKLIDFAANDADYGQKAKTWNLKGQIYNALSSSVPIQKITDPSFKDPYPKAGFSAYEAFQNGIKFAEKKYQKSDALNGLTDVISSVSNAGIEAYKLQDFDAAYKAFSIGLEIHQLLKDNGKKSPFDDKEQLHNQQYITGLAALSAKKYEAAGVLFSALKDAKYNKPEIFDGLYKVKLAQKDTTEARAILAEGIAKYPSNKPLMYSQINDYLAAGKIAELVDKLKGAIAGEPKNASLHATLGNVYDQLSQKAYAAGDKTSSATNFDLAKSSYEKALELEPKNFTSIYSLGTLYYNKAAGMSSELKALESDMTKSGMAKYDAIKDKMNGIFKQALPYFLQAEQLNEKDANTIIALKEIYARNNNTAKATEYSNKLKQLAPAEK